MFFLLLASALLVNSSDEGTTITVTNLGKYPGYSGDLDVSGNVALTFYDSKTVVVDYDLIGVEHDCHTAGDAANSCGIHIHTGTSCSDPSKIGGHYFEGTTDVWASVVYQTNIPHLWPFGDEAKGSTEEVAYGKTVEETVGYLLVVHDHSGARVTCNFIGEVHRITNVGVYPPSDLANTYYEPNITGNATIVFGALSARIIYDLHGVQPQCKEVPSVANACGIHIHEGEDCNNADQPGGHYYNKDTYPTEDPWAHIDYYPDENGDAYGAVTAIYGENAADTIGRVLVVHAADGSRITCAKILRIRGSETHKIVQKERNQSRRRV